MDPNWVTIQAITPGQNRHAVMAELRRERNARGDTTPYRHAPGCIQALKPRKEAAPWPRSHANSPADKRPSAATTSQAKAPLKQPA